MQRRISNCEPSEALLEQLRSVIESGAPLEEKIKHMALVRSIVPTADIDRWMLERYGQLHSGLQGAMQSQAELADLLEKLTAPPYTVAVYYNTVESEHGPAAVVLVGNERRAVAIAEDVGELTPGDEVLLSSERNLIVSKAGGSTIPSGEVGTFSRFLGEGRCVVKSRDEELVLLAKAALHNSGLSPGDQVQFDRSCGVACEKVERSLGEDYFLQDTPPERFEDIGGLDPQIEQLQRIFGLHCLHAGIVGKYQCKPKRSVLLYGPSGTGKTMLVRGLANWLARLSPHGRSHFMNVKPGALHSMWYSQTEANYREIFRVAKEAAAREPEIFTVVFFDEVDAIGSMRGQSIHRIDDRVLNAFMAELNGLEDRGNVVVVSATNLLSLLDTALVRGGRLGDLVLKIPRPNRKAAREIFARHLPAEIPYACNGEGPLAARQAIIDTAVSRIFAAGEDDELAHITFRDGKRRAVQARELVNGAEIAGIAQVAIQQACIREVQSGASGVVLNDVLSGVEEFLEKSTRALTPANCRNYIEDLPQDVDVVSVDPVQRKVRHTYRYFNQVAP